MKTANQKNFARVVNANVQRSQFRIPKSVKTTFNAGYLVPLGNPIEVLPGDTFVMQEKMLARMSTPIFPVMDNAKLEIYAFYVPNRIVDDSFEETIGENKTGAWAPAETPPLIPVFDEGVIQEKTLGNYYGIPIGTDLSKTPVSCLPFRGYALIVNDWFRDENLQAPLVISKGNVANTEGIQYTPNSPLMKVCKPHDYFTSALPAPQKGDSPLIPIELNELIPVVTGNQNTQGLQFVRASGTGSFDYSGNNNLGIGQNSFGTVAYARLNSNNNAVDVKPSNLYADPRNLGPINSTTINELRSEWQIQKLLERDARGGTRFIELLKSHFGVDAGDYRLQRPEFLGMHTVMLQMQSVPQTSATPAGDNDGTPQGNLAAYSVTASQKVLFKKSFVEHGYVHLFAVVRQVKTYQQGLQKHWSRRERFDFYWPELAHISEQPIYNKEIYSKGANPDDVFGYQEAWAEYRYNPNEIGGQFQTDATNSLDIWHYADYYKSQPMLSAEWIEDNSNENIGRTLAVKEQKDDQIRLDLFIENLATRPMPVYSIPGLVDHF